MNEILSLRRGFATNSSSTHSIILTEDPIENDSNGEFGWQHFTLSIDQEKRKYLACILCDHLHYVIGKELATELVGITPDTAFVQRRYRQCIDDFLETLKAEAA